MAHAPSPPNSLTYAVVVGAGMGGLLMAHALSRHVDHVAAMTAMEIDRELRAHRARTFGALGGVSAELQGRVARLNAGAWMIATGEDLRFPGTVGGRITPADRVMRRYLDRVVLAAATDTVANAAFVDVVTTTAPPTSLMHPRLALRVLSRRSPEPSPAPPEPLRRPTAATAALTG